MWKLQNHHLSMMAKMLKYCSLQKMKAWNLFDICCVVMFIEIPVLCDSGAAWPSVWTLRAGGTGKPWFGSSTQSTETWLWSATNITWAADILKLVLLTYASLGFSYQLLILYLFNWALIPYLQCGKSWFESVNQKYTDAVKTLNNL